jgi:hypothetical protein
MIVAIPASRAAKPLPLLDLTEAIVALKLLIRLHFSHHSLTGELAP